MALAASDVFVVQKQAGGEIRKVTAQSLSDYLASGDTVVYKGVGDFTDVSQNPVSPNSGDLWINNALNAGPFAWLPAPNPIPTPPNILLNPRAFPVFLDVFTTHEIPAG